MRIGTVAWSPGKTHIIEDEIDEDPEGSGEFWEAHTACGRTNPVFMAEVWDGVRKEVDCKDCIAVMDGRRYGKDLKED